MELANTLTNFIGAKTNYLHDDIVDIDGSHDCFVKLFVASLMKCMHDCNKIRRNLSLALL